MTKKHKEVITPENDDSVLINEQSDNAESIIATDESVLRQEFDRIISDKDKEIENQKNYALRMQADLENLRRRTAREREDAKIEITSTIVEKILPVYDNLERAVSSATASPEALQEGVEIIVRQFFSVLEGLGLEKIESTECAFDPECHEAVVMDYDAALPDDQIISELQKGYKLKGRLVRPAMVKVNKHI